MNQQFDQNLKEIKNKLGEKIPCTVEVLTPVHIGSGNKLAKDLDFIAEPTSIKIIKQSNLLRFLELNPDELDKFIKGNYKLSSLSVLPHSRQYNISTSASEINEFERNGLGNPYLPGSSIKGSIRTVLLNEFVSKMDNTNFSNIISNIISDKKTKKESASEKLLKEIFGKDSNDNMMRIVEFFDAEYFEEDIQLDEIYILSLSDKGYLWKNLRERRNYPTIDRSTPIIAETLSIGSITNASVHFNNFLVNNKKLNFTSKLDSFRTLISFINNYSKKYLEREREFLIQINNNKKLNGVIGSLNKLIDQIPFGKDEFIIKVGWGGGWKAMTGDYLPLKMLSDIRKRFNLGKKDFNEFPKTRRIVFEDDEPKYLTGWIKVTLNKTINRVRNQIETTSASENIDSLELLRQKFKVTESKRK